MVLSYLNYPDPPPTQDQIAEWSETSPEEGTQTYNMDDPFKILGLGSIYEKRVLKRTADFSEIRTYNSKGHLVIILTYMSHPPNEEEKGVNHYILITGFDTEGIYAHDPSGYISEEKNGPNTYITDEALLQLSVHNRLFWSLVIPYTAEEESRYKNEIKIRGLPPTISINIYVDGKFNQSIMGEGSATYEFTIGTEHQVSVNPYINGSWISKKGTEYFCRQNTWSFHSWNEGLQHTFIYDYINHYYLEVKSEYGYPQGSGWYIEGSPAKISINSPIKKEEGIKNIIFHYEVYYVFDHWKDDITANATDYIVEMDSPKTIVAVWRVMEVESIDYKIPVIAFNIIIIVAILSNIIKSSLSNQKKPPPTPESSE